MTTRGELEPLIRAIELNVIQLRGWEAYLKVQEIVATIDTYADEQRMLSALAVALLGQPRATLQELAKLVGVSNSTLYRCFRTREKLTERLLSHSDKVFAEALRCADLENAPPLEGLRRLIASCVEQRTFAMFLISYRYQYGNAAKELLLESNWTPRLDAFFLRGQQQGVFRIDIGATALADTWGYVFLGLVESERHGRIARASLATAIEAMFLQGALPG